MSSARSAAMDVDEAHVQQIIFDSNMYKEGRPCVLVRTCDCTAAPQCVWGGWVAARVLLWWDQQHALHVTMVKAVSKPAPPKAPSARCSQVPSRPQRGPPLEFTAAEHQFMTKGKWTLGVVENDESTHADVCDFACSAALRDLFVRRLQEGTALIGDDAGLTPLLCPCAGDLQCMLDGSLPSLPLGLLDEIVADHAQGGGVGGAYSAVQLQLLQQLREKVQGSPSPRAEDLQWLLPGRLGKLVAGARQLLDILRAKARDAMRL